MRKEAFKSHNSCLVAHEGYKNPGKKLITIHLLHPRIAITCRSGLPICAISSALLLAANAMQPYLHYIPIYTAELSACAGSRSLTQATIAHEAAFIHTTWQLQVLIEGY